MNYPHYGSFSTREYAGSALAPASPTPPGSLPLPAGNKITSNKLLLKKKKSVNGVTILILKI